MIVRQPQLSDETDAEFLEREDEALLAIAENNEKLAAIRGNIEAHFGAPKPKYHDLIARGRRI